jgi:hypothetical protein
MPTVPPNHDRMIKSSRMLYPIVVPDGYVRFVVEAGWHTTRRVLMI